MDCAVTLAVVGGAVEVIGVGLVLVEVSEDRTRARELLRSQPPQLRDVLDLGPTPPPNLQKFGFAYDDLKNLGKTLEKSKHDTAKAMKEIVEIGDKRLAQTQLILEKRIHDEREQVRSDLEEILAGNIPGRILGVTLIILGIITTTAGQVAS